MTINTYSVATWQPTDAEGLASPKVEIIAGGIVIVLFFVFFLGWCAFARLDVAASGGGDVTVSGGVRLIQQKQGGIVRAIRVKEGDRVRSGQVLVELDSDEARAAERALFTRYVFRNLEVARLEAEMSGALLTLPAEFADWKGEDRAIVDLGMTNALDQLKAQRASNASRHRAFSERIYQTKEQLAGSQAEIEANNAQERLTSQDLQSVNALAAEGYAPANRVRALQKDVAALNGAARERQAQMAGLRGSIGETSSELLHGDSDRAAQIADELRTAEADLQSLKSQWYAARDEYQRLTIKSPVDGDVVGLAVRSPGAVVAPGQTLMAVVPRHAPLVVEARFRPQDIDGLTIGHEARVKFPGIHDRSAPLIKGVLTRLSADTVSDDKSGQRYYTADVKVPYSELEKMDIGNAPGQLQLRPGEPAMVMVSLRSRTALQYLVEPLQGMFWSSLHER
jgi:HlyD family type I secretion membrane fusion protein